MTKRKRDADVQRRWRGIVKSVVGPSAVMCVVTVALIARYDVAPRPA